jgi:hypothetical protein
VYYPLLQLNINIKRNIFVSHSISTEDCFHWSADPFGIDRKRKRTQDLFSRFVLNHNIPSNPGSAATGNCVHFLCVTEYNANKPIAGQFIWLVHMPCPAALMPQI